MRMEFRTRRYPERWTDWRPVMAGPITHVPDRHDDMEFREAPPHTAAEIVAELEKLGTSDLSVRAHKVLKGEF